MRRAVGGLVVAALAATLLSLTPTSAAAPAGVTVAGDRARDVAAFCGSGVLDVADLPARIPRKDCDLVGRTIRAGGLTVVVPPPGEGRIVSATGPAEASLQVTTEPDGTVDIADVGQVEADVVPLNDSFGMAKEVTLGQSEENETTAAATDNEPEDDRANTLCLDNESTLQGTLWYTFKPSTSLDVLVHVDVANTVPSDGVFVVVEAFRMRDGELTRVECDADHIEAKANVRYFIRVGSHYGSATFDFLARAATASDRPGNDMFGDARGMALPSRHRVTRLRLATLQTREPKPDCGPTVQNTVWYRLRPGGLRRVDVKSDAVVAVYTGRSLSDLRRVACLRDTEFSRALVTLPVEGPYYAQVWRHPRAEDAETSFFSGEPCPGCPPPCVAEHHRYYRDRPKRSTLRWRFNAARLPSGLSATAAVDALVAGTRIITRSRNDCGLPDRVSAQAEYLGRTSRRASLCANGRADGSNVIEFGTPPDDFLAVACSRTRLRNGRWRIVESDMRMRRNVDWTLRPDAQRCTGRYDLIGTVAHETGHMFGLSHPKSARAGNLSMFADAKLCNGALRTLGRGDVLGLRGLY